MSLNLSELLAGIATIIAVICVFAALVLYAMTRFGDQGTGRSEGMLVGFVIGAAAAAAAAVFISTQNLTLTF